MSMTIDMETIQALENFNIPYKTPRDILGIHLIVADGCNMDCEYCFYAKKKTKISKETAFNAIRWILDKNISGDKAPHVTFFGGEPTLDEELMMAVTLFGHEMAKRLGKKISFGCVSNFYNISDEFLEFSAKNGIGFLASCDGPRLQDISRKQGSYKIVSENIKKARRIGCRVMIAQQVPPGKVDMVFDDLMGIFEDIGVSAVFQNPVTHGMDSYSELDFYYLKDMFEKIASLTIQKRFSGIGPDKWQVASFEKHMVSIMRFAENPGILNTLKTHKFDRTCGACKGSLAVCTDGTIVPCQQMTVEYPQWSLGNVGGEEFRSDLIEEFKKETFDACKDCIVTSCAPCRTINKYRTGSEHLIPEDFCRYARLLWYYALVASRKMVDLPYSFYSQKRRQSQPKKQQKRSASPRIKVQGKPDIITL